MWKIAKLGNVCKIQSGNSIPVKEKEVLYRNVNEGLPYVATKDVGFDGVIDYENGVRIPPNHNSKFRLSKKNSILICGEGGSAGKKIAFSNKDCHFVNKLFSISAGSEIVSKYVYYYTLSNYFQNQFKNAMHGLIGGVSLSKIKGFKITYPPFSEQQQIVAKLDAAFTEIDKLLKITEDKIKNANILLYIHLKKIFSEGQKDWLTVEIGDLCESLFAGGDVQKNKLSKFKTDEFNVPIFTNGEKNKGLYGFTDKARVFKPSITVSARGTIGYSELRTEPFYPAVRLIVITPNTNIVETDYLKHAIKIISFLNTGSSIPQLTVPMVKKYKIKFPKSKDAQKKIVTMLDNLNSKIAELINISKLKTEKYILLKKSILTQELNNKAT